MERIISSTRAAGLVEYTIINKYLLLAFLFSLFLNSSLASSTSYKINERTRIYTQEIALDSVTLKFDNDFAVPVTVRLTLQLENLSGNTALQISAVVPAKSTGYVLAQYRKTVSGLAYNLAYSWKTVLGDATKHPDSHYVYGYPFQKAGNYRVAQGPHGAFSHKDMFAYDFMMPVGTPIVAARDGVVALIKTDSSVGGADEKFRDEANFISIYHIDGTIANYLHLNTGGAVVSEGQLVKKGEIIGYSGNTGFSTGPHLHFEVIRPTPDAGKNKSVSFEWENRSNGLFADFSKRNFIQNIFSADYKVRFRP